MTMRKCDETCESCGADHRFVVQQIRPNYDAEPRKVALVDLFAGCGGMSLGIAEAARRLGLGLRCALSVDFDETATQVYSRNFPHADVRTCGVEDLFDGELGAPVTEVESRLRASLGTIDVLIGGPPCQGNSDLNNRSRRADPRNEFYLRMGRAAEILRPQAIMIENVPAVQHAAQAVVVRVTALLRSLHYVVATEVIDSSTLGVPQRRKRHVMLAVRENLGIKPSTILKSIASPCSVRTVRWAIADLDNTDVAAEFDRASKPNVNNRERMSWFFETPDRGYDLPNALRPPCHRDKPHSYVSGYGRLHWDKPAQTITTGFTCMGQGRYVHPSHPRTLTPHEAARLQGFPDFFDFTIGGRSSRTGWSKLIGNAVPPQLSMAVIGPVLKRIAELGQPS